MSPLVFKKSTEKYSIVKPSRNDIPFYIPILSIYHYDKEMSGIQFNTRIKYLLVESYYVIYNDKNKI